MSLYPSLQVGCLEPKAQPGRQGSACSPGLSLETVHASLLAAPSALSPRSSSPCSGHARHVHDSGLLLCPPFYLAVLFSSSHKHLFSLQIPSLPPPGSPPDTLRQNELLHSKVPTASCTETLLGLPGSLSVRDWSSESVHGAQSRAWSCRVSSGQACGMNEFSAPLPQPPSLLKIVTH